MLQYIIDAYEQKNKEEGFFKSLKNIKILNIIYLVLFIVAFIFLFISMFFVWIKLLVCTMLVIVSITMLYIFFGIRLQRKNWNENLSQYNESLDGLKAILCEDSIKYYSKNKIKKLIIECEESMNEIISERERSKIERTNFVERYIIPIITFAFGTLNNEVKSDELLSIAIIAIILIVAGNLSIKGFAYIYEEIEGKPIETRKYMRKKLQDLLIRDFEITDKDI